GKAPFQLVYAVEKGDLLILLRRAVHFHALPAGLDAQFELPDFYTPGKRRIAGRALPHRNLHPTGGDSRRHPLFTRGAVQSRITAVFVTVQPPPSCRYAWPCGFRIRSTDPSINTRCGRSCVANSVSTWSESTSTALNIQIADSIVPYITLRIPIIRVPFIWMTGFSPV